MLSVAIRPHASLYGTGHNLRRVRHACLDGGELLRNFSLALLTVKFDPLLVRTLPYLPCRIKTTSSRPDGRIQAANGSLHGVSRLSRATEKLP